MTGNILLKEPLERGVKVIMDGQMANGGYDYDYKQESRNDLSTAAWNVQALKASALALPENKEVKKYMNTAMDGMVFGSAKTGDGGRKFSYTVSNDGKKGGGGKILSAAGGLTLHLTGRAKNREARETIKYLESFTASDTLPSWGNEEAKSGHGGEINFWYYAIQAFFQEDPDGKNFGRFMPSMVKALVQNQASDGHWLDYTEHGKKQGPTYNTTLAALGLMVYYRYLPTTQASNIQSGGVPGANEPDEEDGEVGFEI